MAAAVQVVFAEVLYELQVVEAVGQRHALLQTHIWQGRGGHQCDVSVNLMTEGVQLITHTSVVFSVLMIGDDGC